MSFATAVTTDGIGGERDRGEAGALALEAAHQLGHEVLRVGGGAAVAEGQHAPAGAAGSRPCAADLEQERGARGEEALLQGDAVRDQAPDVVGVHPLAHYARRHGSRHVRRSTPAANCDGADSLPRASGDLGGAAQHPPEESQIRRRWTVSRMVGTAGSSVRTWNTEPSRSPAGTWTGTGKPAQHAALAPAAAAVEEAPAGARAGVAGGRHRDVERQDRPGRGLLGPQHDLGREARRRERPAQVARRGAPHEGPVERRPRQSEPPSSSS